MILPYMLLCSSFRLINLLAYCALKLLRSYLFDIFVTNDRSQMANCHVIFGMTRILKFFLTQQTLFVCNNFPLATDHHLDSLINYNFINFVCRTNQLVIYDHHLL